MGTSRTQEDEQGNCRNKNDVDANSEKRLMALGREQGTDHALFDRSKKPLDVLAMICSAAVGGRGEEGRGVHEKGCAVPGTRNQGRPQKKKRKKRRGQCNALHRQCNATQIEGGRGIIDKIQCKGGRADIGLGSSLLPVTSTAFVPKPCRE